MAPRAKGLCSMDERAGRVLRSSHVDRKNNQRAKERGKGKRTEPIARFRFILLSFSTLQQQWSREPTIGGTPDGGGPGSSTLTMGARLAGPNDDAAEEFPQMDEDEIFSTVEAEAKAWEQKRLWTVTVSLKVIVRQELLDMKIVRESKDESLEGPEQLTTAFDEMIPGQPETGLEPEHLQKREVPLFDLRDSLVPLPFTPRNDISSTIPVARLPGTIEDSYHHISYIYSRCLSPYGALKKSNEYHPLWSELAAELDAQPGLDCLHQGCRNEDPHPMCDLSKTLCDYREGLREREDAKASRSLTLKSWVDRMEDLQNNLGGVLASGGSQDRTRELLAHLTEQTAYELDSAQRNDDLFSGGSSTSGTGLGSKKHDKLMDTMALIEATGEAMDEVDEEAEEEEGKIAAAEGNKRKKSDRAQGTQVTQQSTIESPIQAVTKMLLELSKLEQSVDINWVRKSTNRPDEFFQSESEVIVRIVEALTDYVLKRRMKKEGRKSPPEYNAATMIRVFRISNTLLQYTGYIDFAHFQ
ncbi:MAG: hypothetical protein J3R72DRAFT_425998 [Linnemannia gamsii]|nr:MAG: hypothetical protein J3R72DRAFT_425998 [Linnemannia gamsii]